MSNRITTSTNFAFIQDQFIKAKLDLIQERKTGVINPNRIKGVGLEGSSRSGKSWDICVFICHYVTSYSGKQINVCRDNFSKLRKTFYQTLKKVWALYQLPTHHFNKTATEIHYNGNVIRFIGINDDIMTSHGLESDLLVINETMGIAKETADQLEQRTTEFFIYDYNPSAIDSWLFALENREDYRLHKTNIFDNPYTPLNAKQKILSYAHPATDDNHIAIKAGYTIEEWEALKEKNYTLDTADKFMWEVYGLGLRAVSEDLIFPKWEEYEQEPDEKIIDWVCLGGDFGFKNDPSACVKVTKAGNTLYLEELLYETGLLNNDIATKLIDLEINQEISIWDSAEPKSINELITLDVNAWPAEKGAGSISYGIQKMQQFSIKIHVNSIHLQKEFKKYRWAKDRTGNHKVNSLGKRIPVDKDNHAIDAVRYVILYYYLDAVQDGNNENNN